MADINNFEMYKQVTDEFYLFFKAFRESGFSEEQAFEMTKAYCNSLNVQNMIENIRHLESRAKRTAAFRRYENERVTKEDKT